MQTISFFEKKTSTQVEDCIVDDDAAYFLVDDISKALRNNGSKIKHMQRHLKKRIKVIEYSEEIKKQIKNMFPNAKEVKVDKSKGKVEINIPRKFKARAIGKNGSNIKKMRVLLKRNHGIEEINIR